MNHREHRQVKKSPLNGPILEQIHQVNLILSEDSEGEEGSV